MSVKYRIIPHTRWVIVRTQENGREGGSETMGQFDSKATAERVGRLLAAGENVVFDGFTSELANIAHGAQRQIALSQAQQDELNRHSAGEFAAARDRAERALATAS